MECTRYSLALAAMFNLVLQTLSSPSQAASEEVRIYHEKAKNHPLGQYHDSAKKLKTVEGSEAILAITKKGAFVYLLTRQLTPGNVYTLWFGVYNKPENCKASPCDVKDFLDHAAITKPDMGYADSLIAGADGTAKFSAYIPVGKLRQGWYGNGFQNPQSGEIHLVLHDHGRLIPERAANMLATYRGGCTTDSLFEGFPEISKSDGQPGPNECNLLQLVRFVQDPK